MKTKKQYLQIIELVEKNLNDFLYASDERYEQNLINELGRTPAQAKSLASWDWTHGVGLYGIYKFYEFTKNEKHLDYIESWFNNRIEIGLPEKNVNTVTPLLTMACVYSIRPNKQYEAIMREWAQWIMNDMKRTQEGGIQHCHAELENNEELWDDTLLMTVLFLAKAGKIFNRQDYIEEAIYQFLIHTKYLIDSKTGLWFHGWTFIDRNNFANALWGRGNCWATIFVPEFLEMVEMSPAIKRYAINLFEGQASALRKYQSDTGLWYTLIDDPESYLEASGTAGFCFGILKGVRKGYLDASYKECGKKASFLMFLTVLTLAESLNIIKRYHFLKCIMVSRWRCWH
ncbi:MAG: glycoside hydrolase family 88 protein [Christensenella sp.]